MQMNFKPGDMVDVEFWSGHPVVPGAVEVPFITRGRIIDLADVALVRGSELIEAMPGAVIDVNFHLDGTPFKKRAWRNEAVPLKHIRPARLPEARP